MSLQYWDPDEWEPVTTFTPCTCGGKCMGACNGSASFGHKRRAPEEVAKIKAERLEKEEQEILRRADEIMARRSAA